MFLIVLIIVLIIGLIGIDTASDVQKIKRDWANYRCNPLIMPFAGWFGANAKENFEFCMGSIFSTHSQSYLGSIAAIFTQFTVILRSFMDSISSLRNVIASLGGGINVVFQEFTERISLFFFKLRISAIHMKSLFMRMYAILFSVMYMGMSGITGMTSFTNTFLFSFLDTFCFPEETELIVENRGRVRISEVAIGDVLLPGHARVTGTFRFEARGQAMVRLGPVTVSTNHYVMHEGKRIKAGDHPHATHIGPWRSERPLYCLNTDTHHIPVEYLTFMDYDETPDGDEETMRWVEQWVNGGEPMESSKASMTEYGFAVEETAIISTKNKGSIAANELEIGDRLSTGCEVAGVIRKEIREWVVLPTGERVSASTLYWNASENRWLRLGEMYPIVRSETPLQAMSFVVTPHSQLELTSGWIFRDYMEICSPDSEQYYAKYLESHKSLKV